MALPSVQKAKLENLRQAEPAPIMLQRAPAPSAVVSMAPGPVVVPSANTEPLDESAFAVDGPVAATPGAPPSAPSEPRHADPAPDETDWKAEAGKQKQAWNSIAGKYERLKLDYADLEGKLEQLTKDMAEFKSVKQETPPTIVREVNVSEGVSEQEMKVYGDSMPFLQKVVSNIANNIVRDAVSKIIEPITRELAELRENNAGTVSTVQNTAEQFFANNVRSAVPDMDQKINSDGWQDYLKQRVPYTNYTVGQALIAAHSNRELDRVVEIFKGYKTEPAPSNAGMETPHLNGGGRPTNISGTNKKPMLKISERKKASEDFRKKRITPERFRQIDELYKRAEAENRINYDA